MQYKYVLGTKKAGGIEGGNEKDGIGLSKGLKNEMGGKGRLDNGRV